ncbi:MAG: hypothetical protein JSR54_20140, partial [Proteobacteria bacterium]|nr:hypothetical protein [Pseudomonadota bacterium]
LSRHVANPGVPAVAWAAQLRATLPAPLEAALARGSTAACVWLALALAQDPAVRAGQLLRVREALGEAVAGATQTLAGAVAALPVPQQLPLLQRALPVLKALPAERRATLAALTRTLALADGRITPREYLMGALAARYLGDQLRPPRAPGTRTLEEVGAELATLFAVVASAGRDDAIEARRAYERGLAQLLPRERPAYAAPDAASWPAALDRALDRLAALRPAGRELLVDALGRTVLHDGTVRAEEAELLRATCAVLDCPLPPLLAIAATA